MKSRLVSIATRDGDCPVHVLTPDSGGPWPAVIVFMDGLGIRPALVELAAHLSGAGYVVLLPDLFYRFGAYAPLEPGRVLQGDVHAIIGPMMATTDNRKAAVDAEALIDFLDACDDVCGARIGVVGFCMGGGVALTVAGNHPDRVAAAASFHGGNLASDLPDSPHRVARKAEGEIYVASAENDPSFPAEMAERLENALTAGGVNHRCEIFRGAAHGWMVPDLPSYDEAAARHGWRQLLAVFERALRQPPDRARA